MSHKIHFEGAHISPALTADQCALIAQSLESHIRPPTQSGEDPHALALLFRACAIISLLNDEATLDAQALRNVRQEMAALGL